MNLSWLQSMPKFTHADFGSPWHQPTRWGVTNHLDKPQLDDYRINYQHHDGWRFVNETLWRR